MTLPKAIIVGAGPVGCYAAARLCQTRLVSEVHVYEKQEQVDLSRSVGRNVNITLCKRGNITLCKRVKSLNNTILGVHGKRPCYMFVCLILFTSQQQSFSYKGTGLPGLNKY